MTAQILITEIGNIIQDSRRKNPDLKNAAEKTLHELKNLPVTSETQYAADLRRRPHILETFVSACRTKNPKAVLSGVNCLQRLIIAHGLPETLLKETLTVLQECFNTSTEVQLKILQALPPLLQGYGDTLQGDLQASILQVCISLQQVKLASVSNTASATLQQAFSFLFDKVEHEDEQGEGSVGRKELLIQGTRVEVGPAAYDAYEVFRDVCLMLEGETPKFLGRLTLAPSFGLELIESGLANYGKIFESHQELSHLLGNRLMPLITRLLSDQPPFTISVRLARVVCILLREHLSSVRSSSEAILGILNQTIEIDGSANWRRCLYMEIFRFIYSTGNLSIELYSTSLSNEGKVSSIKSNLDTFVRVAAEKPNLIGVGQQSTYPSFQNSSKTVQQEQAILEAGQAAGMIGNDFGVSQTNVPGISSQSSSMKVPFLEQIDKNDPSQSPETYIYSLALTCINSLSEALARIILPITMQHQHKTTRRKRTIGEQTERLNISDEKPLADEDRSKSPASSRRRLNKLIPPNPLHLQDSESYEDIKAVAKLIEDCWPAVLATASTFLYAALDPDFYRSLIRAFQKFIQVSGLLRLSTPRDAFLTTLAKAAVPPSLLKGNVPPTPSTPVVSSKANTGLKALVSPNSEGFFTTGSVETPASSRRGSIDSPSPSLTQRNLMCLRALANLAIALGPILDQAWPIVLECIQKAHVLLAISGNMATARDYKASASTIDREADETTPHSSLGSEIAAVEGAVGRLFQSTADYPNDALNALLSSLCGLLNFERNSDIELSQSPSRPTLQAPPTQRRTPSVSGIATSSPLQPEYSRFVISRLGDIAYSNVKRMATDEGTEAWNTIMSIISQYSTDPSNESKGRLIAAEIIETVSAQTAIVVSSTDSDRRQEVQRRSLKVLQNEIDTLLKPSNSAKGSDSVTFDIQRTALEGLQQILERTGDSLQGDWEICFRTIESVFSARHESSSYKIDDKLQEHSELEGGVYDSSTTVPVNLLRSAFGSLQLICSDFLSNMGMEYLNMLPALLMKFATQANDLNISLTTITLFWNLADFLQNQLDQFDTKVELHEGPIDDVIRIRQSIRSEAEKGSLVAMWITLQHSLVFLGTDSRQDVRNGAIHTILRTLENNGDRLTPRTWDIIFQSVVLDMMRQNLSSRNKLLKSAGVTEGDDLKIILGSSKVILDGVSRLFNSYMDQITRLSRFQNIWQSFLELLSDHIDIGNSDLTAAVFECLTHILDGFDDEHRLDKSAMNAAASLWASGANNMLEEEPTPAGKKEDSLIAYIGAGKQIYRLSERKITAQQLCTVLDNLEKCINSSSAKPYTSDLDSLTALQSEVLELVSKVRSDLPNVPSRIVYLMTRFIAYPFHQTEKESKLRRLTFVAFSKQSMRMLENFILQNFQAEEIYSCGSFKAALGSLASIIEEKYSFKTQGKAPPLWKLATSTALNIINKVLKFLEENAEPLNSAFAFSSIESSWSAVERINAAIQQAEHDEQVGEDIILSDETFDLNAVKSLQANLEPFLNKHTFFDEIGRDYCYDLFYASIIHKPTSDDIYPSAGQDPLTGYPIVRLGRVNEPAFKPRLRMSYHCFDELFDLVSLSRYHSQYGNPETKAAATSSASSKLKAEAFKFLIARCAMAIKTYISDQPLRGLMPMQTSQRLELLYVLRRLRELRCDHAIQRVLADSKHQDTSSVKLTYSANALDPERAHLKWIISFVTCALEHQSHDEELTEAFQALLRTAIPIAV